MKTNISNKTYIQCGVGELVTHALRKGEGVVTKDGALRVTTGKYTGRSPKDKFIVRDEGTENLVHWGKVNQPMDNKTFHALYQKVKEYVKTIETYEFNGFVGTHEAHRIPIRVTTEFAWHNLFSHQLLVRPTKEELEHHSPVFTVIDVPNFKANPEEDGTNSEAFIITNFTEKVIIIGGTEYAGEIKKSLFGVMNYVLPQQGILPMHCGANVGKDGDVALFFGLSGTGKTTLSSSPDRLLIGDDEHGWTCDGVFNFEGGCYAKTIGLQEEKEPDIYRAIRFGTVLENVVLEGDVPNYKDGTLTENTRAAYPIHHIPNIVEKGASGLPKTIFFLTADAFGVLPPIAKLTKEQAMYYFLNGYTSKLAGTERGITSPTATFSTCFGSPFLPLAPLKYGELLGEKLEVHDVDVYLVNTGWCGGGYGKSDRISLSYTRAMISSALSGELKHVSYETDPIFGLQYPKSCSHVPSHVLKPMNGWASEDEYVKEAYELKKRFDENYKKMK